MELKHVKIRSALLLILLVFSGLLVLISVTAWWTAREAHQALTQLNRITETQTVPVTNTLITVLRARLAVIGAEAEYQNGNLENARHSHDASKRFAQEAADTFRTFQQAETSPATAPIARQVSARFEQFQQAIQQLNLALNGRDRSAFLAANLKAREASEGYYAALLDFQRVQAEDRRVRMVQAQSAYDRSIFGAVGLTLLSLLLVTGSLWYVRRYVTAPLQLAQAHFRMMAQGDLTQDIDTSSRNEIGDLFKSLHEMKQAKRNMIRALMASSSQLAAAAKELSAVTDESQRGLQEQSDQLQQAATAITELSTAVDDVANNALSTSEASQASNALAAECRRGVQATVGDIHAVVEGVEQTSSQVAQLAENSRNIGQILDVIHDVAEQTNLLALNAAIEAARAGEAGRGFAVVADEVRTLAQRTQASTTEIEKLIQNMRQGTDSVIRAMDLCRGSAERTLSGAGMVSSALEEIFGSISQINDRNLIIASAAEEQTQVAREVDRNLINIRDLAAQTAAGANQTSAASQELARLAAEMHDRVVHFRT
ncbi:methyl-accepting chemotaxis protein [Marinobacterium sediminicola]|uniref:Methyl-accepting chemotaxis sensory transducer with TarH sensor n=1 Tax=Marinobacterium sediminicola TaxID=518898 RepID=A0ABY1S150_9GAMM|nr:methyl-accepting chemotaxis protein [Marinobacterium sediminicola]ULG69777.1 methyl-accepting chemotaxis protein [Marinobacterium sediminicola]SMR75412.1 methyl-accepting chemotaxis sensory transducer with TarH sensor [Marinobacterium sediminicola]